MSSRQEQKLELLPRRPHRNATATTTATKWVMSGERAACREYERECAVSAGRSAAQTAQVLVGCWVWVYFFGLLTRDCS